jgi:hypothetical protein
MVEDVIADLIEVVRRMKGTKKTIEWALKHCDECERQNIVWMDLYIGFWIEDLEGVIEKNG